MHSIFDIGAAPANEDCAQLGQLDDFERLNRLEVDAYRAAIQARFGMPPEGCALVRVRNPHDFGVYLTLGLKVWSCAADRPEVAAYLEAVENGLGSWVEAGFTAPVRYEGDAPTADRRASIDEVVLGALMTIRPDPSGRFPIPDFAILHGNLAQAYPDCAELARARIASLA
jgi:hypothetical protein